MRTVWATLVAIAMSLFGLARGAAAGEALKVGDSVDGLTATDENGAEVKLGDFKDKSGLVIFFYPKAFTGG